MREAEGFPYVPECFQTIPRSHHLPPERQERFPRLQHFPTMAVTKVDYSKYIWLPTTKTASEELMHATPDGNLYHLRPASLRYP